MIEELVERMLSGERQSLARLITLVERENAEVPEIMRLIHPHTGGAYSIGITGPLGVGKSTLVDRLTSLIRGKGLSVGIVAVDPSSPFSGGALLGDRIRMREHYVDEGVFIRSMATKGSTGGLAPSSVGVMKLLDAFGRDIILLETVGVGQTELDVMEAADTTVVVLMPHAGDAIQVMKPGLLEIGDILVVNKADRGGAEYLVAELESALAQSRRESWWQVPVLTTEANNNVGIDTLMGEIERHMKALEETGRLTQRRMEQRKKEFIQIMEQGIRGRVLELIEKDEGLASLLVRVETGELDPYTASMEALGGMGLGGE